jgi:hypothetical protein
MRLRYDSWFVPLARVFGVGPSSSTIAVDGPDLHVQMGWAFDAAIPLASVVSATAIAKSPLGRGVHTRGNGVWVVNGSATGCVELTIDPPAKARAVGFGVTLRKLTLSVDDPEALINACPRV